MTQAPEVFERAPSFNTEVSEVGKRSPSFNTEVSEDTEDAQRNKKYSFM